MSSASSESGELVVTPSSVVADKVVDSSKALFSTLDWSVDTSLTSIASESVVTLSDSATPDCVVISSGTNSSSTSSSNGASVVANTSFSRTLRDCVVKSTSMDDAVVTLSSFSLG